MDTSAFAQIAEHFNLSKEYLKENVGEVRETVGDGSDGRLTSQATSKEIPGFRCYHLQYDREGNVVDHHIDTFRTDPNGLMRKLARRYPANVAGGGKPIWAASLPPGAQSKRGTLYCEHPSCMAGPFRTEEERSVHMLGYHREYKELKDREETRKQREEEMAVLKEQVQVLADAVRQMVVNRQEPKAMEAKGGKG